MPPTISVVVISDTICPWCYIGYKELKLAIDQTLKDHPQVQFELEYRPFLLDPTLNCCQSVDKNEHLSRKFGEARYASACRLLSERGKEVDIDFKWSGKLRQTVSGHRLLLHAYQQDANLQETLIVKLFQAYFENEKDIGCPQVLAELAEEAGVMSQAEALELVKSDKLIKEVQVLMMDAHRKGITGVPFTVINQKYALAGAQKSDSYAEIFRNLVVRGDPLEAGPQPDATPSLNIEVCT